MGRRNHGMLTAVGSGIQAIRDEWTRDDHRGGDRKTLRLAIEALQIERCDRGSAGFLAKAKTKLDRRVEYWTAEEDDVLARYLPDASPAVSPAGVGGGSAGRRGVRPTT